MELSDLSLRNTAMFVAEVRPFLVCPQVAACPLLPSARAAHHARRPLQELYSMNIYFRLLTKEKDTVIS